MLKLIVLCSTSSLCIAKILDSNPSAYNYKWPEIDNDNDNIPLPQAELRRRIESYCVVRSETEETGYICTQSDIVVDTIRLAVVRKVLKYEEVEFHWYPDAGSTKRTMTVTKYGNLTDWPVGFADVQSTLLCEIITSRRPEPLFEALTEELVAECYKLHDGNIIKTIKELRAKTNLGLKETKEAFEAYRDKITPPKKDDEFIGEDMGC